MIARAPYRLTGRLRVGLPPAAAFRLFTPRGERDWVRGWAPHFPVPTEDDTAPGTVFETRAPGEPATTWVVVERERPRRIRYARVTPHSRAGTVTVEVLDGDPGGPGPGDPDRTGGSSEVRVSYELTPLADAATGYLDEFASGYPAFLRSWQDTIEAWLADVAPGRTPRG